MYSNRMQPRKSLGTDAVEATAVCAGWNTRLASRRITQFLESRMVGSGLTLAQFGLMAQIAAASDDTLGALAERSGSTNRHCRETCMPWSATAWSKSPSSKLISASARSG